MKPYSKSTMLFLAILAFSIFCIMTICLLFIMTGKATLSISGFAVDDADRLYIGTRNEIRIYENDAIVGSIYPHTSRTYVFTITDAQKILLSTSTKVYTMDLDGNVLKTEEDPGADTYNQISSRKRRFVSSQGDVYRLSDILGWTRIIKNGDEIVYQIDTTSLCTKYLMVICAVALFSFPIAALVIQNQRKTG